jgi:hypothetical protein
MHQPGAFAVSLPQGGKYSEAQLRAVIMLDYARLQTSFQQRPAAALRATRRKRRA